MFSLLFDPPTMRTPTRVLRRMARWTYVDQAILCLTSAFSLGIALWFVREATISFDHAMLAAPVAALNGWATWSGWRTFNSAAKWRQAIFDLLALRQQMEEP